MKTIFATMAAVSALSIAAPAAAQQWSGRATGSSELRMQIDAGVRAGAISRREVVALRDGLNRLVSYERRYGANGINGSERASLQQRGATLRRQIDIAERGGGNRRDRMSAKERDMRDDRADVGGTHGRRDVRDRYADARFDGPNRGDRFAGDVRVGQRYSVRMVELPTRFRDDYRDTEAVYYRYDDDRIYQVDRTTGRILRMLDLSK